MKTKYIHNANIEGDVSGPMGTQKVTMRNVQIIYTDTDYDATQSLERLNLNLSPHRKYNITKDSFQYDSSPVPCTKCGEVSSTALSYTYIETRKICYRCTAEVLDFLLGLNIFKEERLKEVLFTAPQK